MDQSTTAFLAWLTAIGQVLGVFATLAAVGAALAVPYVQARYQAAMGRAAAMSRVRLVSAGTQELLTALVESPPEGLAGYGIRRVQAQEFLSLLRPIQIELLPEEWGVKTSILQGYLAMVAEVLQLTATAAHPEIHKDSLKGVVTQIRRHASEMHVYFQARHAVEDEAKRRWYELP
jgi:hypothetical protein